NKKKERQTTMQTSLNSSKMQSSIQQNFIKSTPDGNVIDGDSNDSNENPVVI
ncbi:hypothetical protein L9F63_024099, partial [Diploptera punctata]